MRIAQRIAWQDCYSARLEVSECEPKGPAARELGFIWKWLNTRLKGLKDARRPKINVLRKVAPEIPVEPVHVEKEKHSPYVRASLYLLPPVHSALRQAAFDQGRSLHELLQEGVEYVVQRHCSKTIEQLEQQGP